MVHCLGELQIAGIPPAESSSPGLRAASESFRVLVEKPWHASAAGTPTPCASVRMVWPHYTECEEPFLYIGT